MRASEKQIINEIIVLRESKDPDDYVAIDKIKHLLYSLINGEEPFGKASPDFIHHSALSSFISECDESFLILWLRIEDYLTSQNDSSVEKYKLGQIEETLTKYLKETIPGMLPLAMANATFMRNLYSANNSHLSALFLKHLPAPKGEIFSGHPMPEFIAEREKISTQIIKNILAKMPTIEDPIIKGQRNFRARKRKKENIQRLKIKGITISDAKELLADANKPYQPQCDPELAARIMKAAKKVKLFSTVKHLTAATALESILNKGLYGRQTMLQLYMLFKPAALFGSDIREGDANVICLGANDIDPLAKHGIELELDAEKIAKNNPCVFYKQRDLGFDPEKVRHVNIGDISLSFTHTGSIRNQPEGTSAFQLLSPDGIVYAISTVKNTTLIAYNIKEMNEILTLNFFRFIDNLMTPKLIENREVKTCIYSALAKITDEEELVTTLQAIGKQMTDTMEFNFYGAYKIDFSALLTISNDNPPYSLNLQTFIHALQAGNIEKLNEAMEKIPPLFNSYRFIDYLLAHTSDKIIVATLQQQREKCTLPPWLEESAIESKHEFKKS